MMCYILNYIYIQSTYNWLCIWYPRPTMDFQFPTDPITVESDCYSPQKDYIFQAIALC